MNIHGNLKQMNLIFSCFTPSSVADTDYFEYFTLYHCNRSHNIFKQFIASPAIVFVANFSLKILEHLLIHSSG